MMQNYEITYKCELEFSLDVKATDEFDAVTMALASLPRNDILFSEELLPKTGNEALLQGKWKLKNIERLAY